MPQLDTDTRREWPMHRLLLLLALSPLSAAAQPHASAGLFVARNNSLPTAPNLAGLELRSGYGALAMRLSAGAGPVFSSVFGERGVDRERVYGAADLDLLLELGGRGVLSVAPFAGVGMAGVTRLEGEGVDAVPMWSWGGAVRLAFGRSVALNFEARERTPFDGLEAFERGIRRGREQRVGLTFAFGGADRRSRAARTSGSRTSGDSWTSERSFPRDDRDRGLSAGARRIRVIQSAEAHLGTRYRYGGASPREGFDCSGFVRYVFARNGTALPRTARDQATAGRRITYSRRSLLPGDLLLFRLEGSRVDHVAIYAGDGRIIHSTSSGGGVRYDDLDSRRGRWFVDRLVTVRRVIRD